MAAVVPRLLWQNFMFLSNTIVTASSQDSALVAEFLREPLRSKVWRSKTGWTVVAGWNNKLDVRENVTDRVATITAGTYATGDLMAAAVQTALNAMGGTNTYTCTYSAVTFKFTIARATGADSVTLKFATGANIATQAALDLAYTATDHSAATTYASDGTAYQSRHYITIDLGSALEVKAAVLMSTMNVSASATVTVQSSASGVSASLTAPTVTQALTGSTSCRLSSFSGQTRRYWALVINDVTNTSGYAELGLFYLGSYFQPSYGMTPDMEFGRQELSNVAVADQGAQWVDVKASRKTFPHKYTAQTSTQKDNWDTIADYLKSGRSFIYIIDSSHASPHTKTFYGFIDGGIQMQSLPPSYYVVDVNFVEALG